VGDREGPRLRCLIGALPYALQQKPNSPASWPRRRERSTCRPRAVPRSLAWRSLTPVLNLQAGRARVGSRRTDDLGEIGVSPELVALRANTRRSAAGKMFPWRDRHGVYRWLRKAHAAPGRGLHAPPQPALSHPNGMPDDARRTAARHLAVLGKYPQRDVRMDYRGIAVEFFKIRTAD